MIVLVDRSLLVTVTDASVCLHARDDLDTQRLRNTLDGVAAFWMPAADGEGRLLPRVTDVTGGAAAGRALEAVVAGGWTLRWHRSQPVEQRPATVGGARVKPN